MPELRKMHITGSIPSLADTHRRFIIAAARGQTDVVGSMLENKVAADATPDGKPSALGYAALGGHTDMVWLLIRYGADLNFRDATGNTPAIYAVLAGAAESLEILMRWGADISIKNNQGRSASEYTHTLKINQESVRSVLRQSLLVTASAPETLQ